MKTARRIVSILYAVISLFAAYVVVMSLAYTLSLIVDQSSIKLVTITTAGLLRLYWAMALFPLSAVGFNAVNLLLSFRKKQSRGCLILLLAWTAVNFTLLLFIPPQNTMIVSYSLLRPLPFIHSLTTSQLVAVFCSPCYTILLLLSIVMTVLFTISLNRIGRKHPVPRFDDQSKTP